MVKRTLTDPIDAQPVVADQSQPSIDGGAQVLGGVAQTADGQQVQLSAEAAKQLMEAAQAQEEKRLELVRSLVKDLEKKRDADVRAKSTIEHRWVDDLRQYDGQSRVKLTKEFPLSGDDTDRTPPIIHATRTRTDIMESRLADILLPNQDQPWDLTVDEEPCNPTQYGTNPATQQPYTEDELKAANGAACQRMKSTVRGQLSGCKFPQNGRRVIRDSCQIGTGLFMGPMQALKKSRKFYADRGATTQQVTETATPEVRYGDPWMFYPDMVESADRAQHAHYLHLMSPLELQDFANLPNVERGEIAKLLRTDPDLGLVGQNIRYRNEHLLRTEPLVNRYAVWHYTGVMSRKDLETLGLLEPASGQQGDAASEAAADEETLQPPPMVDLWYCQGFILKAKLSKIEGDFRIPYYVFSPFPADGTMFGYSVPYMCRDSQRVVNSAWAITLHNASVSSGPLIFLRKGSFSAADQRAAIRGPKTFVVTDPDVDLNKCVYVATIQNNTKEAMAITDRALALLDDEVQLPQFAQGDVNHQVRTSSGLAMNLNAQSIVQRRAAAAFDDDVMLPLIERMYWWNMLFNDDESIKGQYVPKARVQSDLLVKDLQAQHLQVFGQITSAPDFAKYRKTYKWLRAMVGTMDLPIDDLLVSEEDAKKMDAQPAQQPPDPRIEAANIGAAVKREEIQSNIQIAQMQAQGVGIKSQNDVLIAEAKLAGDEKIALTDIASKQDQATAKDNTQQLIAGMNARLEAERVAEKKQALSAQVAAERPLRIA